MTTKLYKIRFLKATAIMKVGQVIHASKKSAEATIKEGFAEYVKDEIKENKRDTNKCLNEFKIAYDLLMKDAPKGYKAWLFPCKANRKDPSPSAILKIDKTSKGSWHHDSARLSREQAIEHIKAGGNIGLSARKDDPLIIGDVDEEKYLNQLPKNTLTQTSRKRTGAHFFGWDKDHTAKINLPCDYGEMRSDNQYVLICGSFVPTESKEKDAGYYTIRDMQLPRPLSFDDLPQFFKDKHKENIEAEAQIKQKEEFKDEKIKPGKYDDLFKLKVSEVYGSIPANKRVSHPLHESDTKSNFSLSPDGSLGHCWRHLVSLNAVQYLCVQGGYSKCEDAGTPHNNRGLSKIKGDPKALEFAYKLAVKRELIKGIKKIEPDKWIIENASELINREFGEEKYIVDKVIPADTIIFIAGNPGDFKSWYSLYLGMCISSGKRVLDLYSTEKAGVLFVDEENGLKRTTKRIKKISYAMDLKKEDLKNLHICSYQDIKLNFKERWVAGENQETIKRMTEIIKEKNIKLVILDSMVRLMEGEENNSSDVRTCFTTLKKVMVNCPDISFLIVHHLTKTGRGKLRDLRGSGDFGAMPGVVYIFRAYVNNVFVDITKHRDLDNASYPLMDFQVVDLLDDKEEKIGIAFNHMTREDKNKASDEILEKIREYVDKEKWKKFKHKDINESFGDKCSPNVLRDALYSGVNRNYWSFVNSSNGRKGYLVESIKMPVEEEIETEEVEDEE